MSPDLGSLRLRALTVPGVARLADHHDGLGPPPRSTTPGALRVFDRHVEIDLVLAADHDRDATTTAMRSALAPLLPGRTIDVTVIDVETGAPHPHTGGEHPEPHLGSLEIDTTEPLHHVRAVAEVALAHLGPLVSEGLSVPRRRALIGICRILIAYDVDPVSRRVLTGQLREHLAAADGTTGRDLVEQLDLVDDIEALHGRPHEPLMSGMNDSRAEADEEFPLPDGMDGPSDTGLSFGRGADGSDPSVRYFTAERFVVVVYDPETGEADSYGPYDGRAAARECRRRRAAFDDGDLEDVVVAVVPLWAG
ncbi:hypothetical protein [Actinomycetospora sp. CA-084318]|uniref:hypothetical protein n=1 Tax=Actinomycetospora sp. CA-084318 TaxID=3239892 RepID=UPI003D957D94